jgi:two-component system, NtrC family, response regulator GlrR
MLRGYRPRILDFRLQSTVAVFNGETASSLEVGRADAPQRPSRPEVAGVDGDLRLVALSGPERGATWSCRASGLTIGSDALADVVLTAENVLPRHVVLRPDDAGRVTIHDPTGTARVDGVRVVEAFVEAGAVITLGSARLRLERRGSIHRPISERRQFGAMVGESVAMREVFGLLERAASSDATVLLQGETGTGKDVAAHSIHKESDRRNGPLVVVDCGAIPPALLESELFGHERGAFTGADRARPGAFEAAHGGTLFLDEVGELGAELQPKLLRAVETRRAKRVGSNEYVSFDVRLVAATNRNLCEEARCGRFRSDLYYRLAVVQLELPALRERRDDIPLLVRQLTRDMKLSAEAQALLGRSDVMAMLMRHDWPGNVRELRNYLERCIALGHPVPFDHTASAAVADERPLDTSRPLKEARTRWNRLLEHRYVSELLRRHDDNVSAAARDAGVSRMYFYRLLWAHGLR